MVIKVLGYKRRVGVRGGPPKINAGGGAGQPPADTSSRALKSRTLALTPGTNSHGRVHSRSSPFKSSGLGLRSAWRVRGPIFGVSWTRAPLGVAGPEVMKPLGLKACRGHKTADKRGRRAAAGGGGGREGPSSSGHGTNKAGHQAPPAGQGSGSMRWSRSGTSRSRLQIPTRAILPPGALGNGGVHFRLSELEEENAVGIQWVGARSAARGPTAQGNRTAPSAEDCRPQPSAVPGTRTLSRESIPGMGRGSVQAWRGEGSCSSGDLT